jgi:hypothetical protein
MKTQLVNIIYKASLTKEIKVYNIDTWQAPMSQDFGRTTWMLENQPCCEDNVIKRFLRRRRGRQNKLECLYLASFFSSYNNICEQGLEPTQAVVTNFRLA